jgi:hypothetical protein
MILHAYFHFSRCVFLKRTPLFFVRVDNEREGTYVYVYVFFFIILFVYTFTLLSLRSEKLYTYKSKQSVKMNVFSEK